MKKPKTPILDSIIAAFEEAKRVQDMTQAELSRRTGLTPARVSEILGRKIDPALSSVEKIAHELRDYMEPVKR